MSITGRAICLLPERNPLLTSEEDRSFYGQLIDVIKERGYTNRINSGKCAKLKAWICKKTPKLDSSYKLATRIVWIMYGLVDFPVCPTCGKQIGIGKDVSLGSPYRDHCDASCSNNDPDVIERIQDSVFDRYGVRVYTQTDEYKVKSKASFKRHYGVDHNMKCEEGRKEWSDSYKANTGYDHNWKNPECRAKGVETAKGLYGEDYHRHDEAVKTCMEKYGVPCYFQTEEFKKQAAETSMENWGTEFPAQAEPVKEKMRKSTFEHLGVEFPAQSPEVRAKTVETWMENYGVDNPLKSPEVQRKRAETCLDTYGTEYPLLNPEVHQKAVDTWMENYGVDNPLKSPEIRSKCIDTLSANYGVDNPTKSPVIRQRVVDTFRENYGVDYPIQNPDFRRTIQKRYKYDSLTFDSKPEIAFYVWLKDNDVQFEYQPDCDFWYEYEGKPHRYYPDFKVGDTYYEIKGDHMISESGEWICPWDRTKDGLYGAKRKCAEANGVVVLTSKDYARYLDYVATKYGKDWLDGFKNDG